jgi:hypothetical protein
MRYRLVAWWVTSAIGAADANAQPADPLKSVVVIRTDLGQGRAGIGTGFFISERGRILTAYHVIQGARQLTVTHHGVLYSNVVVERISPERDLATLVLDEFNGSVPALPLAFNRASEVHGEELRIIGHPHGNLYQELPIRMTTRGYRPSGAVRVEGQRSVFNLEDVKLIQFVGVVNSGMSGAPVISSRGVIGVLSGSGAEGGTLAWAIPSEYVQDATMRAVNRRANEINTWPRLALMTDRWRNLRHGIRTDNRLALALNEYFAALEGLRRTNAQFMDKTERMLASAQTMRIVAEERVRTQAELGGRDSLILEHLESRVTEMIAAGNSWMDERGRTMARLAELAPLIEEFSDPLPSTQRNDSLREVLVRPFRRLEERLLAADTAQRVFRERMAPIAAAFINAFASAPETPAGLVAILQQLENTISRLVDTDARMAFGAESELLTQAAITIERILSADYDDPTHPWRWTSGLGYELTLPGGWEQAGGPEDEELADAVTAFRNDGFTLDKVFGNHIGITADSTNVVALAFIGRGGSFVSRAALDSVTGERNAAARAAGFEVERARATDKDAVLHSGFVDHEGRRTLRCEALIVGDSQTLLLRLAVPPDRHDVLGHCRAIVDSVRFSQGSS